MTTAVVNTLNELILSLFNINSSISLIFLVRFVFSNDLIIVSNVEAVAVPVNDTIELCRTYPQNTLTELLTSPVI